MKDKYQTLVRDRFDEIKEWVQRGATQRDIHTRLGVKKSAWYVYRAIHPELAALLNQQKIEAAKPAELAVAPDAPVAPVATFTVDLAVEALRKLAADGSVIFSKVIIEKSYDADGKHLGTVEKNDSLRLIVSPAEQENTGNMLQTTQINDIVETKLVPVIKSIDGIKKEMKSLDAKIFNVKADYFSTGAAHAFLNDL